MIIENKPHYFLECLVQILFLELFWQKILWKVPAKSVEWQSHRKKMVPQSEFTSDKMKGIGSWFLQGSNLHAYNMVHIAESYCARKYIYIWNMLKILWVP